MPPKKDAAAASEGPTILGRFGTSLRIGIVGMPNVGKSTTFNILCSQQAAAENFPFCTKDPNEGRVPVPDERFDFLCEYHKPASKVPAFLHVTDIAGLVKGASEGLGLGNAFLSHISACDAMYFMCRAFGGDEVTHVEGDVNPVRDLDIISNELRQKDIEHVTRVIEEIKKIIKRNNDKKAKFDLTVMEKVMELLESGRDVRFAEWKGEEVETLNQYLLLTAKPVIYLVNLSEKDYIRKKNKWLPKIKAWVDEKEGVNKGLIIPLSAEFEQNLTFMTDNEKAKYLEENKVQSAIPKIVKSGYTALHLQSFFTAGKDEVRAWTIQKGSKAPQAAGKIHTDFEKGFIMAEVMGFEEFKEAGSEAACKAAGQYRQQGKNYVVADGDIIFFKFNSGAGLTKGKK